MRNLTMNEASVISGGELDCTVTVGQVNTISCNGSESSWIAAGQKVFALLAVSPVSAPGVLMRLARRNEK